MNLTGKNRKRVNNNKETNKYIKKEDTQTANSLEKGQMKTNIEASQIEKNMWNLDEITRNTDDRTISFNTDRAHGDNDQRWWKLRPCIGL